MSKSDFIVAIVLLIFCIVLLFLINVVFPTKVQETYSSHAWPSISLVGLMITSVIMLMEYYFRGKKSTQSTDSREIDIDEEKGERPDAWKKMSLMIALSMSYLISMKYLGFLLATVSFLVIAFLALGIKEKKQIIFIPIIILIFYVLIFIKILYVPVPKGRWIFRCFTLLFL